MRLCAWALRMRFLRFWGLYNHMLAILHSRVASRFPRGNCLGKKSSGVVLNNAVAPLTASLKLASGPQGLSGWAKLQYWNCSTQPRGEAASSGIQYGAAPSKKADELVPPTTVARYQGSFIGLSKTTPLPERKITWTSPSDRANSGIMPFFRCKELSPPDRPMVSPLTVIHDEILRMISC